MKYNVLSFYFLLLFVGQPLLAKTIYVDAGVQGGNADGTSWDDAYPNLTSAIIEANYGDTIWVAQGTYYPTTGINRFASFTLFNGIKLFGGFNGTENSLAERDWQANPTMLSGDIGVPGDSTDNSYTVVFCDHADSTTVIDGFIITGGNADETSGSANSRQRSGGGMYLVGSAQTGETHPVIANCTFTGNYANTNGGGLFLRTVSGNGASPTIVHCTFQGNIAGNGGGLHKNGGSDLYQMRIEGCDFIDNEAFYGGGMAYYNNNGKRDVVLRGCSFVDNRATQTGGVYYEVNSAASQLQITFCHFKGNYSDGEGSAVAYSFLADSEARMDSCTFESNHTLGGGALYIYFGKVFLANSTFWENSALSLSGVNGHGGCAALYGSSLTAVNCIFAKSSAFRGAAASIGGPDVRADFFNCTFFANEAIEGLFYCNSGYDRVFSVVNSVFFKNNTASGSPLFWLCSENEAMISHSIVDVDSCDEISTFPITCGPGMIYNANPMFADTANGDFSLLPSSPAIDAGDNAIIDSFGVVTDLAGNPRILNGTVDMGAYEATCFGLRIYVDKNVQGGNQDGTSWANAYTDLQDALSASCYGDTIWVAQGTYYPTTGTNRFASFTLFNGIKLFGGFNGTETSLAERDWQANPTILSGDIGVPGDSTDNSYTVVFCDHADSTTVMDGFIITGGNADSPSGSANSRQRSGAGMYLVGDAQTGETRPVIANCTFSGNHADTNGGGLFLRAVSGNGASPNLLNCTFLSNSSGHGGGVYKNGSSDLYEMLIQGCIFMNNMADYGGGMAYYDNNGERDVVLRDCRFLGNRAIQTGGVYSEVNFGAAELRIISCHFESNFSEGEGSALGYLFFAGARTWIDSCVFDSNHSITGGTVFSYAGNLNMANCVFWGNKAFNSTGAAGRGGCFYIIAGCALNASNCVFAKSASVGGGAGAISGIGTSADLVNCTFYANEAEEGLFRCYADKITGFSVINSVFFENNSVSGSPIFWNCSVDEAMISHSLADVADCEGLSSFPVTCGPGNLFGFEPLFMDTAARDFSLLPCSPAIDIGDNAIIDSLGVVTDLAGNPRILNGTVDMGAYEHVPQPFAASVLQAVSPSCGGGSNGSFTAALMGGCAPFTVELSGASTVEGMATFTLDGLPSGEFTVIVTDIAGRADTLLVSIPPAPAIDIGLSSMPVSCSDGTGGTATALANGGTGSLGLIWGDGAQGPVLTGLPVGIYTVTATDSLGCSVTGSVAVTAEGQLAVAAETWPVSCFGFSDGIAAAVPDGVAPYTYTWGGGQVDSLLTGLSSGGYTVAVTDALGCTGQATAIVGSPDTLTVLVMGSDTLCFGSGDGELVAAVSGGTAPFSYDWEGSGMDSLLTGLPPGSYSLTVTDANGCQEVGSAIIASFPEITVDVAPSPATNPSTADGGVMVIGVSGGSSGYSFLWSNGDTLQSLENVLPGEYGLTVTDANGCQASFSFTVGFVNAIVGGGLLELEAVIVPNPSGASGAQLSVNNRYPGNLTLQVFDGPGQLVWERQVVVGQSPVSVALPQGLPPGIYWVVLGMGLHERAAVLKWAVH